MTGREITPEWKENIRQSHWARNPRLKKQIVEAHSAHMSDLVASGKLTHSINNGYKVGYYEDVDGRLHYYRSSYEIRRFIEIDTSLLVKSWETAHGIKIPYFKGNIGHFYIPDLLVEFNDGRTCLEEVKGWIRDEVVFALKKKAAQRFCEERGWQYVVNFMA